MNVYEEEDLVLRALGEMPKSQADDLDAQMAEDTELAAQYAAINSDLAQLTHEPVPARDDLYGRRVWAQVESRLESRDAAEPTLPATRSPYGWAVAASLALVAVLAFQVGRMNGPATDIATDGSEAVVAAADGDAPDTEPTPAQRVLAASVSDHLDGAERLLVQISNQDPAAADINIESEREWASVLLTANRLYRYAAERAGQQRVVQVLEDMEPVLIQLANGEGEDASDELRGLRQSIQQRDLIFKARTTEVQL